MVFVVARTLSLLCFSFYFAASDFSSDAQNITFTPGGYQKDIDETVTIEIIDDLIQEPEEVFLVYLEIVQINIEDLRNLELTIGTILWEGFELTMIVSV